MDKELYDYLIKERKMYDFKHLNNKILFRVGNGFNNDLYCVRYENGVYKAGYQEDRIGITDTYETDNLREAVLACDFDDNGFVLENVSVKPEIFNNRILAMLQKDPYFVMDRFESNKVCLVKENGIYNAFVLFNGKYTYVSLNKRLNETLRSCRICCERLKKFNAKFDYLKSKGFLREEVRENMLEMYFNGYCENKYMLKNKDDSLEESKGPTL